MLSSVIVVVYFCVFPKRGGSGFAEEGCVKKKGIEVDVWHPTRKLTTHAIAHNHHGIEDNRAPRSFFVMPSILMGLIIL